MVKGHMYVRTYRVAGNFRGRKFSRIGRKGGFRGMLKLVGVACLDFVEKTFADD